MHVTVASERPGPDNYTTAAVTAAPSAATSMQGVKLQRTTPRVFQKVRLIIIAERKSLLYHYRANY